MYNHEVVRSGKPTGISLLKGDTKVVVKGAIYKLGVYTVSVINMYPVKVPLDHKSDHYLLYDCELSWKRAPAEWR